MRPSRLYRALELSSGELLDVTIDGETRATLTANAVLRHGGPDMVTFQPSTATVDVVTMPAGTALGTTFAVRLTDQAASSLAARTGVASTAIKDRFVGRLHSQSYGDRGNGRRAWPITLTAAAWVTWWKHLTQTSDVRSRLFSSVLNDWDRDPAGAAVWEGDSDRYGGTASDKKLAGEFLADLETRAYHLATLRDGRLRVQALNRLQSRGTVAAETALPLSRSQVLAPLEWVRSNELLDVYRVKITTPTGTEQYSTVSLSGEPIQDLDWTKNGALSMTEQWHRIYGLAAASRGYWSLPRVRVRIDRLISSSSEYDRLVAGRLLALHAGDPLTLAGDWTTALQGVWFAAGISEEITPDAWTLTIDLAGFPTIAGQLSPPIKAHTWEQATSTWDAAGGTWDSHDLT